MLLSLFGGPQKKQEKNGGTILLTKNSYVKEEEPNASGRRERELISSGRRCIKVTLRLERNDSGEFRMRRKQNNEKHIGRMPTNRVKIFMPYI